MSSSGTNDTAIFAVLVTVFILIGFLTPFIENATDSNKVNATLSNIDRQTVSLNSNTSSWWDKIFATVAFPFSVLWSVLTVFFWSFNVPLWMNICILEPMRIIAYFLFFRMLRGVGG